MSVLIDFVVTYMLKQSVLYEIELLLNREGVASWSLVPGQPGSKWWRHQDRNRFISHNNTYNYIIRIIYIYI